MNLSYLFDPAHWDFSDGSIPRLILSHLWYVLLALLIGTVIALPIGLWIGHTGRGSFIAINAGNAGRSLPTLGLLMLMVTLLGLGQLFTRGFQLFYLDPIVVGIVLSVLLAGVADLVIVLLGRLVTPWTRYQGAAS